MIALQQASFYDALDTETRIVVQQRTVSLRDKDTKFRGLVRQTAEMVWLIGEDLAAVQDTIDHGLFLPWLEIEFPHYSRSTAYNFISVYRNFKFPTVGNLDASLRALYLLAGSRVPDSARLEAIERAEAGDEISYSDARDIVAAHKPPALPFIPDKDDDEWRPIELPPSAPAILRKALAEYYENEAAEYDHPDVGHFDPMVHVAFNSQGEPIDLNGMSDQQYQAAHYLEGLATDAGLEIEAHPAGYAPISDRPDYDGDEWKTPIEWLDAARALFGGVIDIDPASNDLAQEIVRAGRHYTKDENGLDRSWCQPDDTPANVWCNPPYSTALVQAFTYKAIEEYRAGNANQVLVLVNNCTDTQWFYALAQQFPVMFSRGRVGFWYEDPDDKTPTRQGQAIFYFGPDAERFYTCFAHLAYAPIGRGA